MNKGIFLCHNPERLTAVFSPEVRAALPTDGNIYTKADVEACPEKFREVEFIFSTWGMPVFTEDGIKACFPSLKAIFYGAGSVQSFAAPFLQCGVRVFSAWRANAIPVAEFTLAQILLANKGYFQNSAAHSIGDIETSERIKDPYLGNFDVTVGVIGVGQIGRKVIELLKPFRIRVIAYDKFLSAEEIKAYGAEKVTLGEIFERSHIVTNHLAHNKDTVGMLDYDLFSRMLPYSTFINTGRAQQTVEDGLVRILEERPDITALLDVTVDEPPVEGHPFFTLKNCFMSFHIAGSMGREVERMGEYMQETYADFINGIKNGNEVFPEMLKTMA